MRITTRELLGRILMTVATLLQGLGSLLADASSTHLLNPSWPAHARLHEAWFLASASLVALVAVSMIWLFRRDRPLGIAVPALLTACNCAGLLIAGATINLYGGTFLEPGQTAETGLIWGWPGQIVAALSILAILAVGVILTWNSNRSTSAARAMAASSR